MANICIPKELIDEVKKLDLNVPTVERTKLLSKFFDSETTLGINKQFERAKLLKNQEQALNSFIENISDIGKEKKAALKEKLQKETQRKKDLIYNNDGTINENFEAITGNTKEQIESFVKKSIDNKYDVSLTEKQTTDIVSLSKTVDEMANLPKLPNGDYPPEYGAAVNTLSRYVEEIRDPSVNLSFNKDIKYNYDKLKQGLIDTEGVFQKTAYVTKEALRFVSSNIFKTLKATMDASFIGIQGTAIGLRNPIAFKNAIKESMKGFAKKDAIEVFRANMFSKGRYTDAVNSGLRILKQEELFSGTIAEKLPVVGGLIKRSDDAFSMFVQNARMEEFQRVVRNEEKFLGKKLDINNEEDAQRLHEIAAHANKVSGTTNLGSAEKMASYLNMIEFAGRYTISDIRMFTDIINPTLSWRARKLAATTLALNLGTIYGGYLTYSMISPDNTDIRPESVNFLKVKGDDGVWYGVKPKGIWLVSLTSKLIAGQEITSKGKIIKYGEGYKPKTRIDAIGHTFRTKLAPIPSVITDVLTGQDLNFNEATIGNELVNLTAPISPSNTVDRFLNSNDDFAQQFKRDFFDFIGGTSFKSGE